MEIIKILLTYEFLFQRQAIRMPIKKNANSLSVILRVVFTARVVVNFNQNTINFQAAKLNSHYH
jgi:hypothetical protein